MNCPEAMNQLLTVTQEMEPSRSAATTAELIREVGLKCISFNGIPRSINCLGTFYNNLSPEIQEELALRKPGRDYTPQNLTSRLRTGRGLWDSVYAGFETKLVDKLAQSHPDLPVHILNGHYSNLLSDPPVTPVPGAKVGRVLTSIVAVTCLRSQTGVGPQVTSHVFGLRKAYQRGEQNAEGEEEVQGGEWLASDDGNMWLLNNIDGLIGAIAGKEGTTFAPGLGSKL